jgi:hypothetical protein
MREMEIEEVAWRSITAGLPGAMKVKVIEVVFLAIF